MTVGNVNGAKILEAEGLMKVFGRGEAAVRAVDGVDLGVEPGQLVLIMGPSGSGKTTLLTLLGGLLRPDAGSVLIEGTDITKISDTRLTPFRREKIGFIFQSFNLWESLSVMENVELPLNMAGVDGREARERARELLEMLGLGPRLRFRSRDLSGGEKQRVSIARALANNPRLVMADEPTANLDSKHGLDVMRLLHDIAKSDHRAVIVVSHDHRIREVADRTIWLEDGRIKDIGKMARDLVCSMSVSIDTAVSLEHQGHRYYFCSAGCSQEFQTDPGRFLAGAVVGGQE